MSRSKVEKLKRVLRRRRNADQGLPMHGIRYDEKGEMRKSESCLCETKVLASGGDGSEDL
jgi:hypothetical protein